MEPAAPPSDLVSAEGRNRKAVLCQRCGSRVLQPGTALFSRRQVRGRGGGEGRRHRVQFGLDPDARPDTGAPGPRLPTAGSRRRAAADRPSREPECYFLRLRCRCPSSSCHVPQPPSHCAATPRPGSGRGVPGGGSGRGNRGAVRRDWAGGHGVGRDGTRGPSWGRGPNPQSARSLPGL